MDVSLKWIGGGTVAAALVLSGIAIGGSATAERVRLLERSKAANAWRRRAAVSRLLAAARVWRLQPAE